MEHIVVTIGREYGSGGRIIAKRISEVMGIRYYDKELITEVAKQTGLSESYIQMAEQRPTNSFIYDLYCAVQTPSISDQVFIAQSKVIKEAAEREPCVFVGRCADYVLREMPKCLKIFVTAPIEERVRRTVEEYHVQGVNPETYVNRQDKFRASYYNYFSTGKWGDRNGYDLVINSRIGLENTVRTIQTAAEALKSGIL